MLWVHAFGFAMPYHRVVPVASELSACTAAAGACAQWPQRALRDDGGVRAGLASGTGEQQQLGGTERGTPQQHVGKYPDR